MDYSKAKQLEQDGGLTPTMYTALSGNADVLGHLVGELQEAVKNLSGNQDTGQVDAILEDIKAIQGQLAELAPKVTATEEVANKAKDDLATLTTRVTATEGVANKAKTDLTALTPRVTATEGVANKAKDDLATLTTRVTATETVANKAKDDLVSVLARLDKLEAPPAE